MSSDVSDNNNLHSPNTSIETCRSRSIDSRLNLDILLPNGILMEITVDQTITLFELKSLVLQRVFDPSRPYPLKGLLTNDPSVYYLCYISNRGKRYQVNLLACISTY